MPVFAQDGINGKATQERKSMRQEVAFLPQRAKAESEREPNGFGSEGVGMVRKEEWRHP